jgi:hypothetical protein
MTPLLQVLAADTSWKKVNEESGVLLTLFT